MMMRCLLLFLVVFFDAWLAPIASAQADQGRLVEALRGQDRPARASAVHTLQTLPPQDVRAELRGALIDALEDEGRLHARRRVGLSDPVEQPELIAQLARFVSKLRDTRAIPGLVGALGMSGSAIHALAEFGDAAAGPVLDVVASTTSGSVRMDALITLRLMAESQARRPLSEVSMARMNRVAQKGLQGGELTATLWRSIDLAIALNDPALRVIVERISRMRDEVILRGVKDDALIIQTQKLAADRLAGIPAMPRPRESR